MVYYDVGSKKNNVFIIFLFNMLVMWSYNMLDRTVYSPKYIDPALLAGLIIHYFRNSSTMYDKAFYK